MRHHNSKNKIPSNKKSILAWCFYDWANSAYYSVIFTFVFAAYFARKIAPSVVMGTHLWGYAIAISGVCVALLSPILGSIADHGGKRKVWLFLLTTISIISIALLWYAYPEPTKIYYTLLLIIISNLGLELGMVFYNALLPSIAPPGFLGRISGWAWGLGYFGGLLCLVIALFGFVAHPPAWLNTETAAQIRICGPLVASWLLFFSLPLFLFVKDSPSGNLPLPQAIHAGLKTLVKTLKQLPQQKNIFYFLLAQMIYIDGMNTLFAFGGLYAAGTFGMSMDQVLMFGILLNLTAGIGAALFAWIDDFLGSKTTILISLVCLIILGSLILTVNKVSSFWWIAPWIGIFVGPTQAASRSLMAHLAPKEKITEMFGLYALTGKATAFIGPWLVAELTLLANSQRVGMSVIFIFFLLGGLLLLKVKAE